MLAARSSPRVAFALGPSGAMTIPTSKLDLSRVSSTKRPAILMAVRPPANRSVAPPVPEGQVGDALATAVGLDGARTVIVEVDLVGGDHRLEVLEGAARDERGGGALAVPEQVRDIVGGDHREQLAGALGVVWDADLLDGHV